MYSYYSHSYYIKQIVLTVNRYEFVCEFRHSYAHNTSPKLISCNMKDEKWNSFNSNIVLNIVSQSFSDCSANRINSIFKRDYKHTLTSIWVKRCVCWLTGFQSGQFPFCCRDVWKICSCALCLRIGNSGWAEEGCLDLNPSSAMWSKEPRPCCDIYTRRNWDLTETSEINELLWQSLAFIDLYYTNLLFGLQNNTRRLSDHGFH